MDINFKETAEHISNTERNSADAERDSKDVKLYAFLESQLKSGRPQSYPALITDVRNFGFFVDVTGLAMSGLVPFSIMTDDFYTFDSIRLQAVGRRTHRVFKLGDRVEVEVAKVDRFKKQVDFRLVARKEAASSKSDFSKQVAHCLNANIPGRILAKQLRPQSEDYFVLKPKHSGFFSTTLNTLLVYLGVRTLIITGIAGDRCVLFTANDAYLRDFRIFVPSDCVLSNTPGQNTQALELMQRVLHADTRSSSKINLMALRKSTFPALG